MAWGALSLAIASFLCIGLGVLFTPVPGVGALFSFGAPLLALAGIILGGRAVSRAKAVAPGTMSGGAAVTPASDGSGLALAAVIASALAFVPAVLTALTCGACNALCATGNVQMNQRIGGAIDPFDVLRQAGKLGLSVDADGGVAMPMPMPMPAPAGPEPDGGVAEPAALPPPPVAPGPKP